MLCDSKMPAGLSSSDISQPSFRSIIWTLSGVRQGPPVLRSIKSEEVRSENEVVQSVVHSF